MTKRRPVDRLLSIPEAATRLGMNYETIRRWIRKGALPAHTVGPHAKVRVLESDIEALIHAYKTDD